MSHLTRVQFALKVHRIGWYATRQSIPQTIDENPQAKCRKVVIGQYTHTYTSSRYAIVCD